MINKTLRELADMCGGTLTGTDSDTELVKVAGVVTDTRKLTEGSLFVPLSGEKFDGHRFVEEAFASGIAASVWRKDIAVPSGLQERPLIIVDDPLAALQRLAAAYVRERAVRVIGVTGSNGKTTTKDMIYSVLSTTYNVHKTQGNYNNHIGLPLTILEMDERTEIAVLEMGMSGRGEIELLSRIARPEVAVITNIGEAHLLQLGSREEIARAKLEIVSGLREDGVLIYNGDEPLLDRCLAETDFGRSAPPARVRFGLSETNDHYPTGMLFHTSRTIFTTNGASEQSYTIPLMGQHNVMNALAAIAVARHFGVTDESIRSGLSQLDMTGMRTEVIQAASGLTIVNDAYNSSPTAVRAAIDMFAPMKGYRSKTVVLGDMLELGQEEEELHRSIGRYLDAGKTDYVYTYGPLSLRIAEGALENMPEGRVFSFTDKEELIGALLKQLSPRDIVLVKASRGMRLEEVVHTLRDYPL